MSPDTRPPVPAPAGAVGVADPSPLPARADVVVIGGGTAGCSAALHLAQAGRSVILFEQRLCGSQASGANYGGVRQQGRCPEELPISFRARALWDRLPAIVGHGCGFQPIGHIKLARTEADFATLEAWAEMARGHGLSVGLMTGTQLRDRHPYLGTSVYGGSFCATDGQANPRLVAPLFAKAARAAGADVREHAPVAHLERDGAAFRVGLADGRSLRADVVLNTAGAWGAGLAAHLGEHYDETVLSPNMLVTEPLPPTLTVNYGICGGDVYVRQTARGNVVFGGGRGLSDLATLWSRPSSVSSARAAGSAHALLPMLRSAGIIRSWTGIEGSMPDDRPVLGESPSVSGLFHAFGFSGHGFALGPAVGAVLADLVLTGRTETDIGGLSPARFPKSRA